MDVKFPLDHYEKYIAAESDSEKELEKKAFLKDVRNRVKEVAKRSYIDPENGTVDYMLLFIPNESIYSFLNQEDAKLIDFSLEKRLSSVRPSHYMLFYHSLGRLYLILQWNEKLGKCRCSLGSSGSSGNSS